MPDLQTLIDRILASPAGRKAAKEEEAERLENRSTLIDEFASLTLERDRKLASMVAKRDHAHARFLDSQTKTLALEHEAGDEYRMVRGVATRFEQRLAVLETQIIASAPDEIERGIRVLDARRERICTGSPGSMRDDFDSNQVSVKAIDTARERLEQMKLDATVDQAALTRLAAVAA